MQYRSILAKFLGAIATYFFRWAESLDPDYDDEWNAIRDAVRRRYAELDEGWTECNLPTMPCPPPLPGDGDSGPVPRLERHPPPIAKGERRVFLVDDRRESVTPPAGTSWAKGGRS